MRVEGGRHPHTGKHPQIIAAAAEGIRSAMISNNERASRFGHWQFRLLVAGAIFYVGWHVLEMYLRAASA